MNARMIGLLSWSTSLLAALMLFVPVAASQARVGVTHALIKVRPDDPAPTSTSIAIEAARNEFESFQVVVGGGPSGVSNLIATASSLEGPGGAVIPSSSVMLYQVGLYRVVTPSNTEGATGAWPDPLIPAVDAYAGEVRNGFPFDVAAGTSRVVWVEVLVPPGSTAGMYTGTVTLEGSGLSTTAISVSLRVRNFELPSTSTLTSAFGVSWNVCAAHLGSYEACGDQIEDYLVLYGRAALDHRISLESVAYYGPDGTDWSRFDRIYGPLLDGTAPTRLVGARQTSLNVATRDGALMRQYQEHFTARGWSDILFDYTCDEPPATCAFSDILARAATAHAAGIRTLVTTGIAQIEAEGLADAIDIAVPVINHMHDRGGSSRRADYNSFLDSSSDKELWLYQSCMSHGCGDGCVGTSSDYFTGWPSYMIDSSAVQNRAMEWLSFDNDATGELYFQTTYGMANTWSDQCDFSGNGDGTLFYPGTPAQIGGTTHIPIESIRLKLIRDGMEDYEYLHMLCTLGDCAMAHREAEGLFPNPFSVTAVSPEDLLAARSRIATRIEELVGGPSAPPDGGVGRDGGVADDAGTRDGGNGRDGGVGRDAGAARDAAASMDGAAANDGGRAGGRLTGGCSCSTIVGVPSSPPAALALLWLALAGWRRGSRLLRSR